MDILSFLLAPNAAWSFLAFLGFLTWQLAILDADAKKNKARSRSK